MHPICQILAPSHGPVSLAHARHRRTRLAACATLLGICFTTSAWSASRQPVAADHGMVVTAHHLATRIGVDVLRRGGNAIDAAVAVGHALAVVYPAAGNLGGGGFMTIHLADGRQTFLDFRETAPSAARPDMYLDALGQVIPKASTRGHLAVAVPGTVAGLEMARVRYGTQTRRALISPALQLADKGFVLDEGDVRMLAQGTDDFRRDAATAAIFLKQGRPYRVGERLIQRDLARTLRRIMAKGPTGFYAGPVGAAIAASSRSGQGLITQTDLAQYRARELAPVRCSYRGHSIVSAPPPSSGGVTLCQILQILEGFPIREMGFRSAQAVHAQIEAMRHAYIDRNSQLGDPAFVDNPLDRLLDKAYAKRLRESIDPSAAADSMQLQPGTPPHEGSNTTHYSIVDRFGNAVAVTYTLNDWFGARVTAAGTGVLLNNEMDDFTIKAGVPNLYGLVQGPANAIAPGKRPLSSMSPTIVLREGQPLVVLGTPGGSRIITAVLHTLLNLIDHDMDVQEAVDAPRFHHQWLPDVTYLEPFALSPDTQALLTRMGHRFTGPQPPNHVAAIVVGAPRLSDKPQTGQRLFGAIDPRFPTGLALGY